MKNALLIFIFFCCFNCSFAYQIESIGVLKVAEGSYKIEQLTPDRFKPISRKELNLGFTSNEIWLRVVIVKDSNERNTKVWFKKPSLDTIQLYFNENREWKSILTGDRTSDNLYKFKSGFYFPIPNSNVNAQEIYIRSHGCLAQDLRMDLVSSQAFQRNEAITYRSHGIMIGSILIIVLYNLLLGFTIKDKVYYTYALVGSTALLSYFSIAGFFKPIDIVNPVFVPSMFAFFHTGYSVIAAIFCIQFLEAKRYDKLSYFILLGSIVFNVLQFIPCFAINVSQAVAPYKFVPIGLMLFSLSAIIAGIRVYRRGNKNAFYYLLAWIVLLISLITVALKLLGVVESNLFTNNFFWVASIIEMFLLSQALAARYRQWKKDRDAIQKKLEYKQLDLERIAQDNLQRIEFKSDLVQNLKQILKSREVTKSLQSLVFDYNTQLSSEQKQDHLNSKIEEVNAQFKEKLKDKFPNLTAGEIEICGFILMELSDHEIAVYRQSNSVAIKSSRYRIRKKMKLEKEQKVLDLLKSL